MKFAAFAKLARSIGFRNLDILVCSVEQLDARQIRRYFSQIAESKRDKGVRCNIFVIKFQWVVSNMVFLVSFWIESCHFGTWNARISRHCITPWTSGGSEWLVVLQRHVFTNISVPFANHLLAHLHHLHILKNKRFKTLKELVRWCIFDQAIQDFAAKK